MVSVLSSSILLLAVIRTAFGQTKVSADLNYWENLSFSIATQHFDPEHKNDLRWWSPEHRAMYLAIQAARDSVDDVRHIIPPGFRYAISSGSNRGTYNIPSFSQDLHAAHYALNWTSKDASQFQMGLKKLEHIENLLEECLLVETGRTEFVPNELGSGRLAFKTSSRESPVGRVVQERTYLIKDPSTGRMLKSGPFVESLAQIDVCWVTIVSEKAMHDFGAEPSDWYDLYFISAEARDPICFQKQTASILNCPEIPYQPAIGAVGDFPARIEVLSPAGPDELEAPIYLRYSNGHGDSWIVKIQNAVERETGRITVAYVELLSSRVFPSTRN